MRYQRQSTGDGVIDLATGACIPPDPRNADWRAYLAALEAGEDTLPATVVAPDPPALDLARLVQDFEGLRGKVATLEVGVAEVKGGKVKPLPPELPA